MLRLPLVPLLVALGSIAGCVSQERVVLLPDTEGKVGKIAILSDSGETMIDRPYQEAHLGEGNLRSQTIRDENWTKQEFGQTLANMPAEPKRFTLYFIEGSDDLTAESLELTGAVLDQVASFPFAEVVVVGHTDTVGDRAFNDRLALDRAQVIRKMLIQRGLSAAQIQTAGRGEREPFLTTPDETPEPRNRRVEITLR